MPSLQELGFSISAYRQWAERSGEKIIPSDREFSSRLISRKYERKEDKRAVITQVLDFDWTESNPVEGSGAKSRKSYIGVGAPRAS